VTPHALASSSEGRREPAPDRVAISSTSTQLNTATYAGDGHELPREPKRLQLLGRPSSRCEGRKRGSAAPRHSSACGRRTWSPAIKVNRTPTTEPNFDQQAFSPSVDVADDCTVTVTYYDFRNNTASTAAEQAVEVFATRDEAESSLDNVRKDDPRLAAWLRVERIDLGEHVLN
jgi:hypothetical protein